MTADGPVQGWADPVAAYLRANIPREDEIPVRDSEHGWNDMALTAYQIGCMALIALGEATEEKWGARPRIPPHRPAVLPRWDDVAVSVLSLAEQQNQFQWCLPDGGIPPQRSGQFIVRAVNAPSPPPPTIDAAHGSRPARATDEVMEALSALGLVADGVWTAAAELVLWRCGNRAHDLVMETDPRFITAVETCVATIPEQMRDDLTRLLNTTTAEITARMDLWKTQQAEHAARSPHPFYPSQPTEAGIRRSLAFQRGGEADWLFFRRWRLSDGWLSPEQAARTLEVFHDPVAIAMRRHVVERIFPGSDLAIAKPPAASRA
jgi:hypothetical protein